MEIGTEQRVADNGRAWLLCEMGRKIAEFDRASNKHKRMHRMFRYGIFLCAAASALLAGFASLADGDLQPLSFAILAISALSGFLSSVEGVRKPAELWLHERALLHALADLRRGLEFETDGSTPRAVIRCYFRRFQGLLSGSLDRWSQFHPSGASAAAEPPPAKGADAPGPEAAPPGERGG
jgi:hypothetical protein